MRHPSPRPKSLCFKTFRLAFAVLLAAGSAARAQERVHFPSDDADLTKGPATEIPAYLFKPLGAGPFPAVVGMHGCGGLFNAQGRIEARAIEWSAVLNARGYAVLYPESFAPRRASGGCVGGGPAVRPWNERPRDAYGALAYLQSLPFVIGDRIGLMGWSHGGGTVLFTIDRSSPARPAALPKGDFRAAVAFYPGWCNTRSQGPRWGTAIPTLFLHGASDDWTPAGPCHDFVADAAKRGSPVEMTIYPGAYHDFDWPDDPVHTMDLGSKIVHMGFDPQAHDAAERRVPEFLDAHLKN